MSRSCVTIYFQLCLMKQQIPTFNFLCTILRWYTSSSKDFFYKLIKHRATALALLNILNNFINEVNIKWINCVEIYTDVVQTMPAKFKSLEAPVKQKSPQRIWIYYMILCSILPLQNHHFSPWTSLAVFCLVRNGVHLQ